MPQAACAFRYQPPTINYQLPAPMLRKIDRILLRVPSLESAVTFYRDVFGLRLVKQDARLANLRLADCDTELVLHADADLPDEAIYYLVDDVRDLYRRRGALRLTF